MTLRRFVIISIFASSGLIPVWQGCSPLKSFKTMELSSESSNGTSGANVPSGFEPPPVTIPDLASKGRILYSTNCAICHNPIDRSTKSEAKFSEIQSAINGGVIQMKSLGFLTAGDIQAIEAALAPVMPPLPGPAPGTGGATPPVVSSYFVPWDERKEETCESKATETLSGLISPAQYKNVVFDIFGISPDVSKLPETSVDFYVSGNGTSPYIVQDSIHLSQLLGLSETVAGQVAADIANKAKLFSTCSLTNADAALKAQCQESVLLKMLSRLYRRNIGAADASYALIKKYVGATTSYADRVTKTLSVALMQPEFLYHFEVDQSLRANGPLAVPVTRGLTDIEMASRLSFFLWDSAPDQRLLDLAQAGTLQTTANLSAQLDRMIADPKADRFITRFADEWLNLNSLSGLEKSSAGFSTQLMLDFKKETELFLKDMLRSNLDFRQFFTSPSTFVNASLATHYKISGVAGTAFVKAQRPESNLRSGFLSQGSFAALSSEGSTDTIFRGLFPSQRLLCIGFGPPPPGATDMLVPGTTKFEVMQNRMSLRSCQGCHATFEPMGYALEAFDSLGRGRTVDERGDLVGKPVQIFSGHTVTAPYDLGAALSDNSRTGTCASEMMLKYATRTNVNGDANFSCQMGSSTARALAQGNNLKSYIKELVNTSVFRSKLEKD